jgi:hypothetical protein
MASVARYCCCGDSGCVADSDTCSTCTDITPAQYIVTFSGVTICGCLNLSPDVSVQYTAGSLSGSFTVSHKNALFSDALCVWEVAGPTVETAIYSSSDGSCGAGKSIISNAATTIRLTRNATTWDLQVFNGTVDLFCDQQTADADDGDQLCATVPAFTNDLTANCGTSSPGTCAFNPGSLIGATGGAATVVCVEA